ncbi:hypothetical protein H8356DRAFT_1324587 [Neocallimastix lanati (nom. inval.)]|nr:hypothetical protein H8356DRAFT_1324587 [Neocallimastix sp. JGI-2020a]
MSTEFQLKQEVCLNKTNFDEWSFLIKNSLMTKKKSKLTQQDLGMIAKSYDALTKAIIISNVPKDVLKHIKNFQTVFDIMAKLKEIYKGSENAKSIYDCNDIISEIKELFSYLEKHNKYLRKLEKLRMLYLSFPQQAIKEDYIDVDLFFKNNVDSHNIDDYKFNLLNKNRNYANYNNKDTVWTFDTGASEHTIGNKNILTNFEKEKVTLDVQIIQPTNLKEVEHMNGHGSKHKTVLYSIFGYRAYCKDFSNNNKKIEIKTSCYKSIHLVRKVVFYEFTPGKLTLTDSNNKNKFNRILPKYFNLENYSIHISNENTTSSTNSVNNQQKDTNQTEDKTGNTNLSHNQQIDDNQIKNIKLNSSYENNSSFIKNNYDKVANNSNMEEIIFTDEPNINNESQNFELISNHSTENIIDKTKITKRFNSNGKNHWIEAMNAELQNLYHNKIMIFKKKISKGVIPITTKWASKFGIEIEAIGFNQTKSIDYDLIYSPTLSIDSLK